MKNLWAQLLLVIGGVIFAAGCAGGPDAQLSSCQQDKDQLLATIKAQRDTTREATERAATLEDRLDEAEKELARRSPGGTRLSSRPMEAESMPWRSPAEKAEHSKSAAKTASSKSVKSSKTSGGSLAALVSRHKELTLDRQTGTAQLNLDLQFENGGANLTNEDRNRLDGVVELLKSEDAADLRIMVSGYASGKPAASESEAGGRFTTPRQLAAARAQAVADYLDSHGIAGDRLAVSGTGSRAGQGGGVDLHLLPADAPVVGWGTADAAIRR